jgi:hypothetical protein
MSRIERTPVTAGDTTAAAELNNTYSDYSQSAALDAPNTRDQAFDLPHFTNAPIILNHKEDPLGSAGLHITGRTVSVTNTTDLASLLYHSITDNSGVQTPLDLSSAPWSLVNGDVLRVWWDLSVKPTYVGTPWRTSTSLGRYNLEDTAGGADETITDGMHCWVFYLEWDITSAGLTDWVAVPNQTNFATAMTIHSTPHKGGYVNQTASTSAVSTWAVYSFGFADSGKVPDPATGTNEENNEHGFYGVSGMWAYPATGNVTVYGVRVILTGVLHPFHLNGGNSENVLVYDITATAGLTYNGGKISAVHMRGG